MTRGKGRLLPIAAIGVNLPIKVFKLTITSSVKTKPIPFVEPGLVVAGRGPGEIHDSATSTESSPAPVHMHKNETNIEKCSLISKKSL